jgi:restriction system protein
MARRREGLVELLLELPWWVNVVVAAAVYAFVKWVFPASSQSNIFLKGMAAGFQPMAGYLASFFLVLAALSALRQRWRKKLLDSHSDLASIRTLSWQHFEKLVAEAYQRQGYWVVEEGGLAPDGGVDLIMRKQNEKLLVQCKHWRTRMVGASVIREMFGVMHAEHGTGCVIVTSGAFSPDAIDFASGKPIQLIDGPALEKLVHSVCDAAAPMVSSSVFASKPVCPDCGASMIKKTARKGRYAGSEFWSC